MNTENSQYRGVHSSLEDFFKDSKTISTKEEIEACNEAIELQMLEIQRQDNRSHVGFSKIIITGFKI